MGFTEDISIIIKDKLLWTIDRISSVFGDEEKLNEEFLHITDEFDQAHPDGLKFLKYIAR